MAFELLPNGIYIDHDIETIDGSPFEVSSELVDRIGVVKLGLLLLRHSREGRLDLPEFTKQLIEYNQLAQDEEVGLYKNNFYICFLALYRENFIQMNPQLPSVVVQDMYDWDINLDFLEKWEPFRAELALFKQEYKDLLGDIFALFHKMYPLNNENVLTLQDVYLPTDASSDDFAKLKKLMELADNALISLGVDTSGFGD